MAHSGYSRVFAQALSSSSPTALFLRFLTAICVSAVAAINFSHAANGTASGALFGAISACAGFASAFALHYLVTARGIANRLTCLIVFLVSLAMCLLASVGAQSTGKGDAAAKRQAEIDAAAFYTKRLKALNDELAALGTPRAPSVIIADINAAPVDAVVFKRSKSCEDISRDDTKKACEPILKLRQEQGRAARKAELEPQIAEAEKQLRTLKPTADADGLSETLSWTLGLFGRDAARADVARSLVLLQSVLIELFAATLAGLAAVADETSRRRRNDADPEEVKQVVAPVAAAPVVVAQPVVAAAPAVHVSSGPAPRPGTADARLLAAVMSAGQLIGTHRELSAKLGMPSSTLSTSARRLADRGLIRVGAGSLMAA